MSSQGYCAKILGLFHQSWLWGLQRLCNEAFGGMNTLDRAIMPLKMPFGAALPYEGE
jgi:hypothetical protein